ncbi:hypothetical protein LMG22037_05540 [Paraburkholderia phenoliruptrix]|jgi:hypothetical protein|uniref:Uncharacterized protein n=1 Tax=Paraburkholderia phenoliruptrix TaxID=252970 RepID=A0A6J5CBP9_9BURK|nr:hypothetical protein [Paraburkholderia phenoliruptrix]CAB3730531.1 hypothetical protein LMG22037_05540 [Paraburkholderia phenoliruptrix]
MATLFLDPLSSRIVYFHRSGSGPVPTEQLVVSEDGKRGLVPSELRVVDVPDGDVPAEMHALNCAQYRYSERLTRTDVDDSAPATPSFVLPVPIRAPHVPEAGAEDWRAPLHTRTTPGYGAIAAHLRCAQAQAALRGEDPSIHPIITARARVRGIPVVVAATQILEEVEVIYDQISRAETDIELARADTSK